MKQPQLKTELVWLGVILITVSVLCLLKQPGLGASMTALALTAIAYAVWTLLRFNALVNWLESGASPEDAPQSFGLSSAMIDLIHRDATQKRREHVRFKSLLNQFNSLASDLPDATVVLNPEFEIRWANAAAAQLMDISLERDKGQRIDNLVREPAFSRFLHFASSAEEVEMRCPAREDAILAIRKVPTDNGMLMLVAADITQKVQVREMRKAFVADVSHELRTPLTVILGYLEMLQEAPNLSTGYKDALAQVAVQSERMQGIVEDLLELSKLEANPLPDNEGDIVNIPVLVRSIAKGLEKRARSHSISMTLDESLGIVGSERELYSLCNNLLTNAIRYTEPGTQIEVSWQTQADGTALFQVCDDGPGIEAKHLPRLSERFYRVDSSRSSDQGGTGLGLAIVKHAVQRHGGELEIDSTPGEGSTFGARFPVNRVVLLSRVVNG